MQLHITPSLITLPDAVAESLSTRPGCQDFSEYLANHKKWLFLRGKGPAGDIKDIICLPEISTVLEGKVPVPSPSCSGCRRCFIRRKSICRS